MKNAFNPLSCYTSAILPYENIIGYFQIISIWALFGPETAVKQYYSVNFVQANFFPRQDPYDPKHPSGKGVVMQHTAAQNKYKTRKILLTGDHSNYKVCA